MKSHPRMRFVLLCEDEAHEIFFRRVCRRLLLKPIRIERCGRAQEVIRRSVHEVRALRSKRYQEYLGLIVVVDGDAQGSKARRQELGSALVEAGLEPRRSDDRMAIITPTRHIETWVGSLIGITEPNETRSYKHAPWMRGKANGLLVESAKRFVEHLIHGGGPELPSLRDGLSEMRRFMGY